jgi:predicted MFS family arabinose efflux permease
MMRLRMQRGFLLLWLGDTINALGSSITVFVLPIIAATTLHVTPLAVGLLSTARWLPAVVVSLPAGAWTDRTERRAVLLGCNALSAAVMATIPLLGALGALSMIQLYATVAVAGALAAVFNTAYVPYFSVVLKPEDYQRGISRIIAARTAALLCGPAIGGVLATTYGPPSAVLADVASFAVSFACLSVLPRSRPDRDSQAESHLLRDIRDGVSYLRGDPYLWRLTITGSAQNLLSVAYGSIQVIFLLQTVHARPQAIGYLLAAGAAGSILGAAAVPKISRLIGDSAALRLFLLFILPLSTLTCLTQRGAGYVFFAVGQLAMAVALAGTNVIIMTFRQGRVPNSKLARVSATMQVCLTSTMPLGGLLGGALAEMLGIRNALWCILPATIVPGLILLRPPFRRLRDLPLDTAEAAR